MVSTFSPNKLLEKPANGDDVDTWDVPVNADWDAIDLSFGGTATLNVTAAAGTISLTAAQYRPPMITVTGTLTSNVNYQFPTNASGNVAGLWSVINNATGAFTVTFSSAGGGATVVVPAGGVRTLLQCDGTNVIKGAAASGANNDITALASLASVPAIITSTANTFTGTQTLNGTSSTLAAVLANAAETTTISATAATGTIAYYANSQSVLYFTSNAVANWTVNLTFSAGTTFNTAMSTGQTVTVAFLVTQGVSPFYNNVVQVDGTTVGVTTKWQGGAPTSGGASSVDIYSYSITKTGAGTFSVFATQTHFS